MKRWICTLLALLVFVALIPVSWAYAQPIDSTPSPAPIMSGQATAIGVTQEITGTNELTGTLRIATALALYFDRSAEEILALHAAEWGFGNIAKAFFTALEANVSFEQILQLREQGIGWGEIRQSLELAAGMPHQSLGQIIGQGHGRNPDWVPPGQLKKQEEGGWVPPGLAKKQGKSNGPKGKP
jgi:hypothetical protein